MSFFDSKKGRSISKESSAVTILTAGCHFNGKLYCKGSSRIGGKIEGEIVSEGVLVIEDTAEIQARVKAEEIILHGNFSGTITATSRVVIAKSSEFHGDIETPSLLVDEGAKFNGKVQMASKGNGAGKKPNIGPLHTKPSSNEHTKKVKDLPLSEITMGK